MFFPGGTPYVDVKNKDLAARVMRGMRLRQTSYISDDLYQLMLQCWQIDLDERPNFDDIVQILTEVIHHDTTAEPPFNFKTIPGFQYEHYSSDLEYVNNH